MKRPLNNQRALTLIELLLVLAILGVLSAMVIPNFSGSFLNLQSRQAAEDISFLMRYAQGRAISQGNPTQVVLDLEKKTYWLMQGIRNDVSSGSQGGLFERIQGKMGRTFLFPKELIIQAESSTITFYPDGKMDKTKIYLSDAQDHFYTIMTQGIMGRVEVFPEKIE